MASELRHHDDRHPYPYFPALIEVAVKGWLCALLAVALLALLPLTSCTEPSRPRPHVVIVLIDTLRADRLGAYGSTRGLTPFLDQLAAKGTVFRSAFSTSSWTAPAVASLFTSRYPTQTNVVSFESKLANSEITLAERLQQAGYLPIGFLAHFQLSTEHGFAQGFDAWWTEKKAKLSGDRLREETVRWLAQRSPSTDLPLFLYLHYLEPHAPYIPPQPFYSKFLRAEDGADFTTANQKCVRLQFDTLTGPEKTLLESLYDGEVAAADAEIERMFAELDKAGVLDNAIIVITADHGEEFMEHGQVGHGLTLYDELVRIPLIIIAPGIAGGQRIEENVSLVDVAPTLLELTGTPAESRFEGRSLAPLLQHTWSALFSSAVAAVGGHWRVDQKRPTDILVELHSNGASFDLRRHRLGIIRGSAKLLVPPRGTPVAYDLAHDAGELTPVPAAESSQAPPLLRVLESAEADLRSRAGTPVTAPLDAATREKLRALGYHTEH